MYLTKCFLVFVYFIVFSFIGGNAILPYSRSGDTFNIDSWIKKNHDDVFKDKTYLYDINDEGKILYE